MSIVQSTLCTFSYICTCIVLLMCRVQTHYVHFDLHLCLHCAMIFALVHCTLAQVGAEKSLVGSGEDGARRGVGEAGRVLATFSKCLILRLKFEDNFQSRLLAQPFWFISIKVTQITRTEEKISLTLQERNSRKRSGEAGRGLRQHWRGRFSSDCGGAFVKCCGILTKS